MTKIKLISIDMFRTLVDLESVEQIIWHKVLKGKYSVSLALECSTNVGNAIFGNLPPDKYVSLKSLFTSRFTEIFSHLNVKIDPSEAANIWARHHDSSKPFGDSMPFLNSVGKQYPICLASDADEDMLGTLRKMYKFDCVFTSEQLGSYKAKADGKFFTSIVDHYGLRPEEIIHIGDGAREIIGARKAGVVTCWLNRKNTEWSHEIKPDYEVCSLVEAAAILGINMDLKDRYKSS